MQVDTPSVVRLCVNCTWIKGGTAILDLPCHAGGRSSDTCIHTNGITLTIHMKWLMTVICEDQKQAHQPVAFLGKMRLRAITDIFWSPQHANSDCMLQSHDAFDAAHDATQMAMTVQHVQKVTYIIATPFQAVCHADCWLANM